MFEDKLRVPNNQPNIVCLPPITVTIYPLTSTTPRFHIYLPISCTQTTSRTCSQLSSALHSSLLNNWFCMLESLHNPLSTVNTKKWIMTSCNYLLYDVIRHCVACLHVTCQIIELLIWSSSTTAAVMARQLTMKKCVFKKLETADPLLAWDLVSRDVVSLFAGRLGRGTIKLLSKGVVILRSNCGLKTDSFGKRSAHQHGKHRVQCQWVYRIVQTKMASLSLRDRSETGEYFRTDFANWFIHSIH